MSEGSADLVHLRVRRFNPAGIGFRILGCLFGLMILGACDVYTKEERLRQIIDDDKADYALIHTVADDPLLPVADQLVFLEANMPQKVDPDSGVLFWMNLLAIRHRSEQNLSPTASYVRAPLGHQFKQTFEQLLARLEAPVNPRALGPLLFMCYTADRRFLYEEKFSIDGQGADAVRQYLDLVEQRQTQ